MRELALRRHTDNAGDVLTDEGVAAALAIGHITEGAFHLVASTGAQRATQTAACIMGAAGLSVPGGVIVEPGLRSDVEDRWRQAYRRAGSGHLEALREVAPDLVESESTLLGAALRRVLERLENGQRALVIGHSPTTEAAVLGLTGVLVDPLGKGEGVLVREQGGGFEVQPLD